MEVFSIYLWLKLNTLLFILGLGVAAMVISCLIALGNLGDASSNLKNYRTIYDTEGQKERVAFWGKWLPRFLKTGVACLLLILVIPSAKETAILVGTHYAVQLGKSAEGAKVMTLIRRKANEYLDEQLKEATK